MPDDPTPPDPVNPPAGDPPADPPADPPKDPPADPPASDPPASDDWRASIQDDKARKFADEHTSVEALSIRALNLRKELSSAIAPLAKKPTNEQVETYRKATGVPKTPEEYKFPDPPAGEQLPDVVKAFRAKWAGRFHKLHVPSDTAAELAVLVAEDGEASLAAQIADDKTYADESMAKLKREWPGEEFETNKQFADRAVAHLFPDDILAEVRNIETKDGRFVLDDPNFVRVFAQLGREMESRGPLVAMSEGERMTVGETATEIRKKAQEAHGRGDFGEADRLSEEERRLYARRDGEQPIVGSAGRTA